MVVIGASKLWIVKSYLGLVWVWQIKIGFYGWNYYVTIVWSKNQFSYDGDKIQIQPAFDFFSLLFLFVCLFIYYSFFPFHKVP